MGDRHLDHGQKIDRDIIEVRIVDETFQPGSCYICRSDAYSIGEQVAKLRCRCPHWVHQACLSFCIRENSHCPTCRVEVSTLDPKSSLLTASHEGDITRVTELLHNGVGHSVLGGCKETPLMLAADDDVYSKACEAKLMHTLVLIAIHSFSESIAIHAQLYAIMRRGLTFRDKCCPPATRDSVTASICVKFIDLVFCSSDEFLNFVYEF